MPETDPSAAERRAEGRLVHAILAHADVRPGDPALSSAGDTLTWRDLRQRVLALAGAIAGTCGPRPGRIALLGPTSCDLAVAYLASVAAGATAVPLPVSAHPQTLAAMLRD